MRVLELEEQLRCFLPLYTPYFCEPLEVVEYTATTTEATVETATPHLLEVGEPVTLNGVEFINPVVSATQVNGVATIEVQYPSNYTYPYSNTITLEGATESEYNGTFDIIDTPTRKYFRITVPVATPATATGDIQMIEYNSAVYNNMFAVTEVVSPTVFKIAVNGNPFTTTTGTCYPYIATRIAGVISIERGIESYTKQENDDFWLFIAANNATASTSLAINTDFVQEYTTGDFYRSTVEEAFSIYVVTPTVDSINPAEIQDYCRNELKLALIKSLVGFHPADLYYNGYQGVYYQSDEQYEYNTAYYIHKYNFGCTVDITLQDIFVPRSYAFNRVNLNYVKETDTTQSIANDYVDLTT